MLLLRDHYKAAVDEKVGALLLLPDPIWRPNFTVALAWAQRHFGQRLRPETVSALRSRLREVLDVPVPLVQLFPQPAPGAVLPRFTLPAGPPPPAPGLRSPGPGPEALDVGVGPAERRSPARLPSPTFSLAFSSSPSSPPLCPPIPPASSSSPVPLTPSPPRPAAPGLLQSTTPLAQMTRLASSRLRRRVAAMPAPGPSSSPLPPPPPPPPPPSGSTPPHGLARADAERNDVLQTNPFWSAAQRRRSERIWIDRLGTMQPLGLNVGVGRGPLGSRLMMARASDATVASLIADCPNPNPLPHLTLTLTPTLSRS